MRNEFSWLEISYPDAYELVPGICLGLSLDDVREEGNSESGLELVYEGDTEGI